MTGDGATPIEDRLAEWLIRISGVAVASVFAAGTAVLGAFLAPLRVGTVPVPIGWLVVALGVAVAVWFARWVTRSRFAAVLPAVAWCAVLLPLTSRTGEGDVVVTGDWVGYGVLLAGAVGLVLSAFLVLSVRPDRRPEPRAG